MMISLKVCCDDEDDEDDIQYSQKQNHTYGNSYDGRPNNSGVPRTHSEMENKLSESQLLEVGVSCREKL